MLADSDSTTEPDPYTEVEISDELVNKLRDAQQAYDEVKEYFEAVKQEIKDRFADHDRVLGTNAGEKIFTCVRRENMKLDSRKLKREYPDIWQAYVTPYVTQYLTVVRPKASS